MSYFDNWWEHNSDVLENLYYELIYIAKTHGIKIINNQTTINSFIKMMYYESTKELVDYNLYPEFIRKHESNYIDLKNNDNI
jgi:hypothetical protein